MTDYSPYFELALCTVLYTAKEAKRGDKDAIDFIKTDRLEKYLEGMNLENHYVGRKKLTDLIRGANLNKINEMIRVLREEDDA